MTKFSYAADDDLYPGECSEEYKIIPRTCHVVACVFLTTKGEAFCGDEHACYSLWSPFYNLSYSFAYYKEVLLRFCSRVFLSTLKWCPIYRQ